MINTYLMFWRINASFCASVSLVSNLRRLAYCSPKVPVDVASVSAGSAAAANVLHIMAASAKDAQELFHTCFLLIGRTPHLISRVAHTTVH
jgi:hypothetical protein